MTGNNDEQLHGKIVKYKKRVLELEDKEMVRNSLKKLYEMDINYEHVRMHKDLVMHLFKLVHDKRNGEVAKFLIKKWHIPVDKYVNRLPKSNSITENGKNLSKCKENAHLDIKLDTKPPKNIKIETGENGLTSNRTERQRQEALPSTSSDQKTNEGEFAGFFMNDLKPAVNPSTKSLACFDVKLDIKKLNEADKTMTKPTISSLHKSKKVKPSVSSIPEAMFRAKQNLTTVFSGRRKSAQKVESLKDICIHFIAQNIDDLEEVGHIPYELLKPALQKASSETLAHIEDVNQHLLEDTDELWETIAMREIKNVKKKSSETWREFYFRAKSKQQLALQQISKKVANKRKEEGPQRMAEEVSALTPAFVRKRQHKFGTGYHKPMPNALELSRARHHLSTGESKPTAVSEAVKATYIKNSMHTGKPLTKKSSGPAPLMKKTLKMLKGRR